MNAKNAAPGAMQQPAGEAPSGATAASGSMTASGSMAQAGQMGDAAGTDPSIDPKLMSTVLALPPRERVLRLTRMSQPDFDAFFKSLKGPQRRAFMADLTPDLRETVGALENPERLVVEELMAQRLTRDIYSNAQLQEVMTDFWLNHFNVFLRKNEATP